MQVKCVVYCSIEESRQRSKQGRKGFTLLELMIASLIVTVGLLSILSLILFALKIRYDSRLSATALKLSQQMIESFKSRNSDDPILRHPGNDLTPDGTIDFSVSADQLASTTTVLKLNQALGSELTFDTRWNVYNQGDMKIITVATRNANGALPQIQPVNLKIVLSSP